MLKRFFTFLSFFILLIFIFSFKIFASDDTKCIDEILEENDGNSYEESLSDDYFEKYLSNCIESVDLPESYDFNYDAEKHQNRDPVYGQIYGFVRWTDDLNNTHALQDVTVVIRPDNGSDIMTRTDNTGFYLINFYVSNPSVGSNIDISIYSSCSYVRVYQTDEVTPYCKHDTIHLSGYYSDVYNYTFNNSVDGDNSRGMQILAALQNYYTYAASLVSAFNYEPIPLCKAVYPYYEYDNYGQPIYDKVTDFYSNNNDTIYLSNECNVSESPYSYSSWDVIGHEFGHHIQKHFFNQFFDGYHSSEVCDYYNLLYYDVNYNGNSTYPLPLSDMSKSLLKKKGCGLALKESWPTFFSITAQKSFSDDIKMVPTVNNNLYEAYNLDYNYDISGLYSTGINAGGESTERAIMSLLYNLYDTNNSEPWDNVSISDTDFFEFMVEKNPENLSEFLYQLMFNSNINVSINDIGKMLSAFHISSYELVMTSYSNLNYGPGFSWNRGNINFKYPWNSSNNYSFNNNYFDLKFYDGNDNLLYVKTVIPQNPYAASDLQSCILSTTEWNAVLQCPTNSYYIVIVAYSNNYYSTGPFYSERYYFDLPTTYDINLNNFSYYEKQFSINQNQEWLFNLSFSHSGYKLIQTFGSNDTVMRLYNDFNILLIDSDDEGYSYNSLVYYNFNANETYHLYVGYYNNSNYGLEKITITPCTGDFSSGMTEIEEFEDINGVGSQNYITYQTTILQNESRVLLWTPSSTGYYIVSLNSQFDNVLYVIDPSSSNLLVEEVDYCDDYVIDSDQDLYDDNARLGVYCSTSMTYFIILGKSSPELASGNITLTIYKTM